MPSKRWNWEGANDVSRAWTVHPLSTWFPACGWHRVNWGASKKCWCLGPTLDWWSYDLQAEGQWHWHFLKAPRVYLMWTRSGQAEFKQEQSTTVSFPIKQRPFAGFWFWNIMFMVGSWAELQRCLFRVCWVVDVILASLKERELVALCVLYCSLGQGVNNLVWLSMHSTPHLLFNVLLICTAFPLETYIYIGILPRTWTAAKTES
jgi:hypothetical protein